MHHSALDLQKKESSNYIFCVRKKHFEILFVEEGQWAKKWEFSINIIFAFMSHSKTIISKVG